MPSASAYAYSTTAIYMEGDCDSPATNYSARFHCGIGTYTFRNESFCDGVHAGLAVVTSGLPAGNYQIAIEFWISGVYQTTVYPANVVLTGPPLPDNLSGLTATGYNTYVHLTWTASANATGYHITWSPGSGSASVGAVTSSDILSLTNGTSYTFTVTPTNSAGSGGSQSVSATPHLARPSNFAWTVAKTSGGALTVTAAEWASLCSSVNSFRLYKSLTSYSFTGVTAGVTSISAAIFNEVRTKINDMSPPTGLPSAVTSGVTTIAASHFNGLVSSLNSIT